MIFLDLSEGLGNQMFQYAFARSLQEKYGDMIYLDTQSYTRNKGIRSFSLMHYKLNEQVHYKDMRKECIYDIYIKSYRAFLKKMGADLYDPKAVVCYERKGFYIFQDTFGYVNYQYDSKKKNKYVMGSWMNSKYFEDMRKYLLDDLVLKDRLSSENEQLLSEIKSKISVCIHIRLGDYLDPKWSYLNICSAKYYQAAYELLSQKLDAPEFYIFSNTSEDLRWIKCNYTFLHKCHFVALNNPDYQDLELMRNCRHFVISNSTYSWWAQYLCDQTDKVVIAPKIWSRAHNKEKGWQINGETIDLYEKDWIILDI